MAKTEQAARTPSAKARALSARLMAVQAVHQNFYNPKTANEVADEYLSGRAGMKIDGEEMVAPDPALFRDILFGIGSRIAELDDMIRGAYSPEEAKAPESLIRAILLCAAYELIRKDIDAPVVINDYLNVTHGYFGQGEVALVNGVLDNIAKKARD